MNSPRKQSLATSMAKSAANMSKKHSLLKKIQRKKPRLWLSAGILLLVGIVIAGFFTASWFNLQYRNDVDVVRDRQQVEQAMSRFQAPPELQLKSKTYRLHVGPPFDESVGYNRIDPTYTYVYDVIKPVDAGVLVREMIANFKKIGFLFGDDQAGINPDYPYNGPEVSGNIANGPVVRIYFNDNTYDNKLIDNQLAIQDVPDVHTVTIVAYKSGMSY